MNRDEIERRVVKVVSHVLKVDEGMVEPTSHFVFDLGAESTQSVELVAAFEAEFAQAVGSEYAVAVSNCTTALHLALRAAG
jgi:acyl carrier protein